ncbi:macrolide transporter subunit MacA [Rubripirellula amarantea]|uniref:Macrolide transporter subunit MacA n=1 Tax=Rubripirellula amarantea TaxID=2527999 RepID=A0A5C5WH00_9BACT|nr:HlyD family efflux transporter periplasmic adaptor subunit [Rubripirellula amarantea]TWT49072.1 macrolide transporter subunit MacA [Rubripirellula amarantea]
MLDRSSLLDHGTLPLSTETPVVLSSEPSLESTHAVPEHHTKTLAAVVALLSTLDHCDTAAEASQNAVDHIQDYLSANRVMLLWRSRSGGTIAKLGDTERTSAKEIEPFIIAAGEEIAARDMQTRFPPTNSMDRHALLAVAQLVRNLPAKHLNAIRLSDHLDRDRGTLIVLESSETQCETFLNVVSRPLASAIHRIVRLQPSVVEQGVRNIHAFTKQRSRIGMLAVAVLFSALMLIPATYRVAATVELQPVERRFIAVPVDGPLLRVHVRPGDLVEPRGLLAEIDPREIDFELAGSQAQLSRAEQERKAMIAEHDFAGSQIAVLEQERLRNQTQLLEHQRGNLEIRSPINGIIISGDHTRSEGMPMTRGETLFEIAPLGEMMAEIAIPESEIAEVQSGMECTFHLHAYPNRTLRGTIERINPRAELRDHENVFIAEVRVKDPDGLYRPGMRGQAKIESNSHPLGWNLFHRAYYSLARVIGW